MADDLNNIVPLDELDDFEVADEDPDVRGWEVIASDGRRIGEVDDLLVDTTAMKVRYLDVDVDEELLDTEDDRHILLPIGYARLDEDGENIIVDELVSSDVTGLPEFTHEPITREYEVTVRRSFEPGYTATPTGDFYAHDIYDVDRFYGRAR